jgi:hypothetical protein
MDSEDHHHDVASAITRVKTLYASCKSYIDRGQMTSILPQEEGDPIINYQTFSTVFVRPDKFRFEFRDRYPEGQFGRYVVWREGDLVKTWWYQHNPKIKIENSLGLGLAGATGVSHGVAVTIPQLLLPQEISARGLFDEAEVDVVRTEECQDCECVKLHTKGWINRFVWVQIESGLILRVEEQSKVGYKTSGYAHEMTVGEGPLTSRTIISYKPAFDVEISPSQLEFGEPFAGYGDDVEVLG